MFTQSTRVSAQTPTGTQVGAVYFPEIRAQRVQVNRGQGDTIAI